MPASVAIAAIQAGVTAALTTTTFWTAFATNILLSGISSALPSDGE